MRLFQPVGGFPDKHLIGIDENGHSHTVKPDGTSTPAETVESPTNRAIPTWTQTEMENLVRGGKWEEVTPQGQPPQSDSGALPQAPAPKPADVANRPAEPQPQAPQTPQQPPGDAKPTDDQASGKVRPFPDAK